MPIPFEQTVQGHQFYNRQLPDLIKELKKLNENIETFNKNVEKITSIDGIIVPKTDEMPTIKKDTKGQDLDEELPFL